MSDLVDQALKLFSPNQVIFGKDHLISNTLRSNWDVLEGTIRFAKTQTQVQRLGAMINLMQGIKQNSQQPDWLGHDQGDYDDDEEDLGNHNAEEEGWQTDEQDLRNYQQTGDFQQDEEGEYDQDLEEVEQYEPENDDEVELFNHRHL